MIVFYVMRKITYVIEFITKRYMKSLRRMCVLVLCFCIDNNLYR